MIRTNYKAGYDVSSLPRQRLRLRYWLFPLVCIVACGLLILEAYRGERGLSNLMTMRETIIERGEVLERLRVENEFRQDRINRLRPENLDLDFLDELARAELGLVDPTDRIILQTN